MNDETKIKLTNAAINFSRFALLTIYRAYIICLFWGWFVEPAFCIPSPGIVIVIGLFTLHRFLQMGRKDIEYIMSNKKSDSLSPTLKHVTDVLVIYTVVAAFGWVIQLFT